MKENENGDENVESVNTPLMYNSALRRPYLFGVAEIFTSTRSFLPNTAPCVGDEMETAGVNSGL